MKHRAAFTASLLIPMLVSLSLLLLIPASHLANSALELGKLAWFSGIMFIITNAVGLYYYGLPRTMPKVKWNPSKRLIVTYVSRGDNAEALKRAIAQSRQVLRELGVNYLIEAITDLPVDSGADRSLVVPATYSTRYGAKYKARALEYGRHQRYLSDLDSDMWILHMDEESVITPAAVAGINHYISDPFYQWTIGQGEIKYNAHNYGKNLLITAVDALRTGDDLGRFRFQYKLFRKPLFGMHGSFFLLQALLEERIGFDLSPRGSITEDAYFALIAAHKGVRFGWVEGFIREQSPFTLKALLKQRRRWIAGLRLLVTDPVVSRRQRYMLGLNMFLWRIAWVGPVITLWNFIAGGSLVPQEVTIAAALVSGMVGTVYMVGSYRNIAGANLHPLRQIFIWLMTGLLVPVSCMIEGLAVLYSIIRPVKTFEVVAK